MATGDPRVRYVAERVARSGWGPADAIRYARDRDSVALFREAVMLARLCADRAPGHEAFHRLAGLTPGQHADWALVAATGRSLGLSDTRQRALIEQLDAEDRARAALAGER